MDDKASTPGYIIKVLIVDDVAETRESVNRALTFETAFEVVGIAGTGEEGVALAKSLSPDIVLMDINMRDMDGFAATALIANQSPNSQIIMMSMQNEKSYMQRAMVAGARAFISKPVSIDELYATIRTVYERRRANVSHAEEQDPGPTPGAHVIMVYAPQAGAGATTIATNLAMSLMRDDTKVLLVDCNLYFGDVGIFLNIRVKQTIGDLLDIADDVDMSTITNVLVTHDSGLRVLLAPSAPQQADTLTAPQVVALIERLRPNFDFVVLDTATHLDKLNLALFDLAEQILLIGTPTLPAVKNVHNILDLLDAWQIDANKVQVVLNRVNTEFEAARITPTLQSIEHNLKRKIVASIPMDERRVLPAINRGVTVVTKDRHLSPARELIALAESLREIVSVTAESVPEAKSKTKVG